MAAQSQTTNIEEDAYVIITSINIEGNKRTKDKIILRELNFGLHDTIKVIDIQETLAKSRQQVLNISLFNKVTITSEGNGPGKIIIQIVVEERWYIFPVIIFELADRNFNVWWIEQNKDLSRTEYGIKFYHENFRGRNEKLKLVLQAGYTEKYELFYTIPFIDRRQIHGTKFFISYSKNKQIAYESAMNKQVFVKTEDYIRNRFYTGVTFSRRKTICNAHYLKFEFQSNSIHDTVIHMNDNYFGNGNTLQRYLYIEYRFEDDRRDIKYYPLNGSKTEILLSKRGLGIFNDVDIYEITAGISKYWQLSDKEFFAAKMKARFSFPQQQPYYNQDGLGFGQDFVRGYEYYVVESQHYGLFRATLKHRLFSTSLKNTPLIPLKQFKTIPIAAYFKLFADVAYAHEQFHRSTNIMNNGFLPGWGVGIDFTSYYDIVVRVEYSFNNLFEKGLYLHFKLDI